MTNHFATAFSRTMKNEGGYSNDPADPGGETYMGITRRWFGPWAGWPVVDDWKAGCISALQRDVLLTDHVRDFYKAQFWDRVQGDAVSTLSPEVAYELFDTGVNLDIVDAVRFLQEALNMQNQYGKVYPDIAVDGKLGTKTLGTLKRYLEWQPGSRDQNEQVLLNCMNGEQYLYYKSNPNHERFRGWFARVCICTMCR